MKTEFSGQTLEKSSNAKFHENPFSGSRIVPCGENDLRTDRNAEANICFSQFCERT